MIANSREQHFKTALKKNYSILNQALERYQLDNGERYSPTSDTRIEYGMYKLLSKYCTLYKTSIETSTSPILTDYRTYNGKTVIKASSFDDGSLILADGAFVMIEELRNVTNPIFITVDVNGYDKKPNRLGKDTFMFQLMPEGNLLPMGAPGTVYTGDTYCSDTSWDPFNGASCTNKVLNGD